MRLEPVTEGVSMATHRPALNAILSGLALAAFAILSMVSLSASAREMRLAHQVLAFYYPWWGTPAVSGKWRHWGAVDMALHRASGITDYPMSGPYDSHDPNVVASQIREASEAGITGFITSWWGINSFEDQAMPLLLQKAAARNFLVSAYYEHVAGNSTAERREAAYQDLKYILQHYGRQTSFLKVSGTPVIFLYDRVLNEVPLGEWPAIEGRLRQNDGLPVLLIGPGKAGMSAVFDGTHVYVAADQTTGKTPAQLAAWAVHYYHNGVVSAQGKISCLTVIPGFDDRSQAERPKPRPVTDRYDGQTYRVLWRAALVAHPDWVLITSWNEWHEGTEIEPSRQYDSTALKDTPAFAHDLTAASMHQHNLP